MKVVKVYGALRKYLGQCRFQFEADTPAQAIKALCVNFPGLDKWLLDSEQDGVAYRISIGKEKIAADDLSPLVMPWSERQVFSITPVIAGAGRTGAMIGIGIGLIALSFISFWRRFCTCWCRCSRRTFWRRSCCWCYRAIS